MHEINVITCDLCVLGGGGAGLTAAARAATLTNKKIVVVEKGKATGGGACQAGDFRVYGSKWQKDRGLDDNLSADLRKRMDETYWELDRKLVLNAFLGTGRFFDWCCTLALDCAERFVPGRYVFDRPDRGPEIPVYAGLPGERSEHQVPMGPPPEDNGDERPAGMPMGGPGMRTGTYLMKLLRETCEKNGVKILLNTRVTDAEVENGKFTAILAEGPDGPVKINCKAVVMATGSWISNRKYLEMANPTFARLPEGKPRPSGHQNCNYTGDSIPLAEKVGAFVDYDSFCIRPMGPGLVTKTGDPIFPKGQMAEAMLRSPYALQIDEQGRRYTCEPSGTRFAAEDSAHVVITHGSVMPFVVFDLNTARYTAEQAKKNLALGKEGGMGGPARVTIGLDEIEADLERESFMFKGDTVEELAKKMGVPAENLKETIELYNHSCETGFDEDCFKDAAYLVPLKGPFYGFMTALNTDGAFGGVQVNANIQAYKRNGGLVEGLWVPGDFSSGRFVNDRGLKRQVINDLAWAFSSGFIAGEQAAAYLQE